MALGGLLWPFLWALWGPAGLARLGLSGPFFGLFRAFLASFLGLVVGVLAGSPTLVLPGFLLVSCLGLGQSLLGSGSKVVERGGSDSLLLPLVWSLSRGCEACRRWPGEGKYFLYSYFTSSSKSINTPSSVLPSRSVQSPYQSRDNILYNIYISPDQSIQSPDQSQIRHSNNILYNICIYIWMYTLSYNYSMKTN